MEGGANLGDPVGGDLAIKGSFKPGWSKEDEGSNEMEAKANR